jgi:hypothetical protein
VRPHLRARSRLTRRPRPILLAALAIAALYASVATWERAHRPAGRWVGRTNCSWRGDPVVEIRSGLARSESIATVAHESVHVVECRSLGPVRYRWNTIFASSNLALELPAYCAAARVRLASGWSLNTVRSTVLDDMRAAMGDQLDSARLEGALMEGCRELR